MDGKTRPTLLERLRDAADPLAWDEFFGRYWPLVYAAARHRGCSDHTAEEIVQEVMLKVFRQQDIFRYDPERGRFRDWLRTLVRNQVAEYRRGPAQRVRGQGDGSDVAVLEPLGDESDPDTAWEAEFEQALLVVLLDVARREIPAATYLAFELLTLHELPGARVAATVGISRNAVYKARRRVLARLAELAGTYATDGRLHERIKSALESRPPPPVERSLSNRIEKTMRSR